MTETCRVTLGRKRDVADKLMILKWKIILDYLEGSFGGPARGFCRWLSGKESTCQCRRRRRLKFDPWVGKILWRRKWQPTPVFLLGESHGQRSLAGYSPWSHRVGHSWVTEPTHAGLRCFVWAFSSCSKGRLLFVVGLSFLTVVASLVAEHGL